MLFEIKKFVHKDSAIKSAAIVVNRENGEEESGGVYDKRFFPEAKGTERVRSVNGVRLIDDKGKGLPFSFDMDKSVSAFGLFDSDKKRIDKADPRDANSDFWTNESLSVEIHYSGKIFDTNSLVDSFWLNYFFQSERIYWPELKDRPMNMSNIDWIVTRVGSDESVEDKNESLKSFSLSKTVLNLSDDKVEVLLDSVGYYNQSNSEEVNRELLFSILDNDKKRVVGSTGEVFREFFDRMVNNAESAEWEVQDILNRAKRARVLDKEAGYYNFDNVSMGTSYKQVREFLMKSENSEILDSLKDRVMTGG